MVQVRMDVCLQVTSIGIILGRDGTWGGDLVNLVLT